MNKESVKSSLREIMENNQLGYFKLNAILTEVRNDLMLENKGCFTEEEMRQYREFEEKGPVNLELLHKEISLTDEFAYGIQTVKAMFDDVDFSRPFRIIVDYDPEQPRTIVKKYLPKEAAESYTDATAENQKD